MNIQYLQQCLSGINEITVLGKCTEIDGVTCHVMGVARYGQKIQLLVLYYDEAFRQWLEEAEESGSFNDTHMPETNRDALKGEGKLDTVNPLRTVSRVFIGNREFEVHASENKRLNIQDWEGVLLLSEFLRRGWQPIGIDYQRVDMLFMTSIELNGEFSRIPDFGKNPMLRIVKGTDYEVHMIEQPLTLAVGGMYPDKLWFQDAYTGEKHWVQINRVYLSDIWADMEKTFENPRLLEQLTPEQIAQAKSDFEKRFIELCPRGMCFPVIEYESEEGITLQFYSRSYLDSAPAHRNFAMGFIVGPDKPTGVLGMRLEACIIHEPVPADTVNIEAELFQYNKARDGGEIVF